MSYKVTVVIEKDEHGYYAYTPELPGCQTQGDSIDEAMANVREAIDLYLDTLTADEARSLLSHDILTAAVEVQVA
jgi:predicted RNase H-like HicB family nuclease